MSRRRRAVKREILPDAKFGDIVITRFMNALMYDGKKSVAEGTVFRVFCGSRPLAMSWLIVGIAPLSFHSAGPVSVGPSLDRQSPPAGIAPPCGSWSPRPRPAGRSGGGAARDFGLQTTAALQLFGSARGGGT